MAFRNLFPALAALGLSTCLCSFSYAEDGAAASAEQKVAVQNVGSGDFLSARFAGTNGDRDAAARFLEESLKNGPSDAQADGQLLVLYLSSGQMEKALERAKKLESVEPHELIVDLLLAVDLVKRAQYAEAEAKLKRGFAAKGAESVWLPLLVGWLELAQQNIQKPIQLTDMPQKGGETPPFLLYQLAMINDLAGFTDVARKQYEAAVADQSRAPFRAVEALADFYRRQGEEEKLTQLKLDYIAARPNLSVLVEGEDMRDMAAVMAPAAEKNVKRVVATPNEGIAEVLFAMGSVLYGVDAEDDTQLYLRMALYIRPDFPLGQLLLGSALESEGHYADAADVYGGINANSPLYSRALLRRAFMIERTGRVEQAIAMLDERAKALPKQYDAYVAKGDLLRSHSRFKEAAVAYSQAIARMTEIKPSAWGVFFARGACLEMIGDWKRAEPDLRQALALDPDQPEVLNYLGYSMLVRDQNIAEARIYIEKAYALQPDMPHILDSMGWALYKSGEIPGAVEFLEQAIQAMSGDATVNDHLGDAYWQAGRKTEARFQWEKALSFKPEAKQEAEIRRKLKEGLAPIPLAEPDQHTHAATGPMIPLD